MHFGTIAAIVASAATVIGQFALVIRKLSRIEFKVDMMWRWFSAVSRARPSGRRKYDGAGMFVVPEPDAPTDVANDEG